MSDADEIRKLYQLYTNALAERNFEKVGAMYTEDGMLIPPDQPPLVGPAQICKHYADSAGGDYEMSFDKIETSNKLAWVKGTAHCHLPVAPAEGRLLPAGSRTLHLAGRTRGDGDSGFEAVFAVRAQAEHDSRIHRSFDEVMGVHPSSRCELTRGVGAHHG